MNIRLMWNLLSELEQLRQHDRWTRSQLEAHQAEALHCLRAYAYALSPFYQKFHRGLEGRPLSALPVLTKAMLMEHFDDLVTDRTIRLQAVKEYVTNFKEGERYLDRYWVNTTAGSTGRPGYFLFDEAEWTAALRGAATHIGREHGGRSTALLRVPGSSFPTEILGRERLFARH